MSLDNDSISYDDWINSFQPRTSPEGVPVHYDDVNELTRQQGVPQNFNWSEIWDFDEEISLLTNGVMTQEQGAIAWYVTTKPWKEGEEILVIDLPED